MRYLRQAAFVTLGLMLVGSSLASAQRTATRSSAPSTTAKALELGADAGLSLGLDQQGTALEIPISNVRIGVSVTDVVSIEPFGSIQYFKASSGGGSLTRYEFGVGGLYHFSADRMKQQMYVRPFLSLVGVSASPGGSNSDIGVGVGFGVKFPKMNGRIAWRGEANIASVNSQNSINFLFGLSVFPR